MRRAVLLSASVCLAVACGSSEVQSEASDPATSAARIKVMNRLTSKNRIKKFDASRVPAPGTSSSGRQGAKSESCSEAPTQCTGAGCEPSVFAAELGREIVAVVGDSRHVYYTVCRNDWVVFANTQCELKRIEKKRNGKIEVLATNEGVIPGGLAIDDTSVYFASQCLSNPQVPVSCKVRRYSKLTGAVTTLIENNGEFGDVISLASDGEYLYGSGGTANGDGKYILGRYKLDGSRPLQSLVQNDEDLNSVQNYPTGFIQVDSKSLFYAGTKTHQMPKAGGAGAVIFDSESSGFLFSETSLAIDNKYIYSEVEGFASEKGGVWRTPVKGGESERIFNLPFSDGSPSTGMDADGNGNVVWTNDFSAGEPVFTRAVRMYVEKTGEVVELGRGIKSEVGVIPFFEKTHTDGEAVYFAINAPLTSAELDARCEADPSCPIDWNIYAVDTCKP